jgi:stearoyl-CoA desaturase (delta-9 desaturase)
MDEATLIPVPDPHKVLPPTVAEGDGWTAQVLTLAAIIIPLLGILSVPFLIWGWGFRWTDLGLLVGMYVLTTLGVTVGFHRLFVHRSFETYIWIQFLFAVLGSMAAQGALFRWVAIHRIHHHFSDQGQDPHSPNQQRNQAMGVLRGFWHAHIGWFFDPTPANLDQMIKDLSRHRALRVANRLTVVWVVLGLLLPALLGLIISGHWNGFWTGLIWGGAARVFLVHHLTWSINSACHLWGRRTFRSGDMSRNNVVFGYLGMGEGWHNTHHAFPGSARHGLRWWQLDMSFWVIRMLASLGLAWGIKTPTVEMQQAKVRPKSSSHLETS